MLLLKVQESLKRNNSFQLKHTHYYKQYKNLNLKPYKKRTQYNNLNFTKTIIPVQTLLEAKYPLLQAA